MVTINIKKKHLFLLSAIVVFLVGVGLVISYSSTWAGDNPVVLGHSPDEIEIGGGKQLDDIILPEGKIKCSAIGQVQDGGSDSDFCNDGVTACYTKIAKFVRSDTASVYCTLASQIAVGGGCRVYNNGNGILVSVPLYTEPSMKPTGWYCDGALGDSYNIDAYVICCS